MTGNRIFNIQGDYIEHQTNNFYDHSQYNSTGAVMNTTKGKDERHNAKSKTAKDTKARELMTFRKRGITEGHISVLYTQMVTEQWIAPETAEVDFVELFSGERSECKAIWTNKYGKGTLVGLFKAMRDAGVISVPDGFTLSNILMGHFVDMEGNFLTGLDKGDAPADKAKPEIEEFVGLLQSDLRNLIREQRSNYGDSINKYELAQNGMRRV